MSRAEHLVNLAEAACGQVLSRPLEDARGQVLMAAGAVLSAAHIESLRRRDVQTMWVLSDAAPDARADQGQAERRARSRQRMERLFRNVEPSSGSIHLLVLLRRYRDTEQP